MHIVLCPDVQAPEGLAVGTADGKPLHYIGRIPHIDGVPHRQADLAPFLAAAVDEAATKVWGGEWNSDLARVTKLNRRTVTRDRVEKFGLPSWVLSLVGTAAAHRFPRALGHQLLAIAELNDNGPYKVAPGISRTERGDRPALAVYAKKSLDEAMTLVAFARDQRSKHLSATED